MVNSSPQAIMYVLCFRMRSIMDVPRLKSQLLLMPLETVLKHNLNPLKVSFFSFDTSSKINMKYQACYVTNFFPATLNYYFQDDFFSHKDIVHPF